MQKTNYCLIFYPLTCIWTSRIKNGGFFIIFHLNRTKSSTYPHLYRSAKCKKSYSPSLYGEKICFLDHLIREINIISSIVKGHLDTQKYSFLINIPSLIWRNLCLFGDPILENKFIPSIVKGHLDTKKFAF